MTDEPSRPRAPLVELCDASKSYGAVKALREGSLSLSAGEVRGLIGENGAGKSTLVKVLGGVIRRDAGELLVDGEPVDFRSPHDARDARLAVIYQEPTLLPDLSVAENVVMGYHPLGALKRIDRRAMHGRVKDLLDRLGVRLDRERPVRGLSIADQQIVEIAKALSFDARVLIMDEPTAALSGPEVERLFSALTRLWSLSRGGLIRSADESALAREWGARLQLKQEIRAAFRPITIVGCTQTAEGRLKLLVAEGESIPGETFRIGNTNSRLRFSLPPAELFERWCEHGPTHHVALGIGHVGREVRNVARLLDLDHREVG